MNPYDHSYVEKKWQKEWAKKKIYTTKEKGKKFYVLDMFPYPSGEGLHVGHPKGYIATDVISRMKRMQGHNVLHPMGFDAFGLPAENYAIKMKTNPMISVAENIERYKQQLEILGFDYDWSREINTTDPKYYKWTQWIFKKLHEKGLAYESYEPINWCPFDKTGLANEDVEDGRCERCGTLVEKKPLRQWVLRITDYAERLLADLDAKDVNGTPLLDWPESIKEAQRNWIGKSEGAEIEFAIDIHGEPSTEKIKVFTTRPDTLFGVTYVVLAPEHAFVQKLIEQSPNKQSLLDYITATKNTSQIDRTDAKKEKTGVEITGVSAINPANGTKVPVWIADYVLADYGTGAVMAVPAHDERDWVFAKKYNLPIIDVVTPIEGEPHAGSEFRKTISAIVHRKSDNKFLALKWKKFGWTSVPVGGIEGDESPEITAEREVLEETGYVTKAVRTLGGTVESHFFAENKNVWRARVDQPVLLELVDENKKEVAVDELEKHECVWLTSEELLKQITHRYNAIGLERFIAKNDAYTEAGKLINSGKFDGLRSEEAKKKITTAVGGNWVTKYKLRDWVFSRQRYWGEPFPIIHCEKHGVVLVPEKELPVELPKVESYEPTGTGESPLAGISEWVNTKCPQCIADKKKPHYLIFDFDGVLGDTWTATLKAKVLMGDSKTEEEAQQAILEYFDKKPFHAKNVPITQEKSNAATKWSRDFGEKMATIDFDLFHEFIKEIKKYKKVKIAVVSSGSRQYVIKAMKKSGLKPTHILAFEDSHSKEEKIERICKDWKVDVKDIYYFTDTKADVYELEDLLDRNKLIGCAWGYQGFTKLNEVLPDKQILKDFADIHRILNIECSGKRETNTMPQWAGSSWYHLRYMDPTNKKVLVDPKKEKFWNSVDLYVGGAEHATRHLIYARFWHKFLYDIGVVSTIEPFSKLQSVGLIMAEDGRKMSKRFGNVVNPDEIVRIYGADTLRLYEMFMGPFDQAISWSTDSMVGSRRFIERVWKMGHKVLTQPLSQKDGSTLTPSARTALHKAIKKVGEDIEDFRFNTAISTLMITLNELEKEAIVSRSDFEVFLKLAAPFIPHVAEELWNELGNKKSIHLSEWPTHNPEYLVEAEIKIVVQINGKVRATFTTEKGTSDETLQETALNLPETKKWLNGGTPKKVIIIKEKLVNIVI